MLFSVAIDLIVHHIRDTILMPNGLARIHINNDIFNHNNINYIRNDENNTNNDDEYLYDTHH